MKILTFVYHNRNVYDLDKHHAESKEYLESKIQGAIQALKDFDNEPNKLKALQKHIYNYGADGILYELNEDETMKRRVDSYEGDSNEWEPNDGQTRKSNGSRRMVQ